MSRVDVSPVAAFSTRNYGSSAVISDGTKALVTPTAMEIGEVYAELALIQHVAHREEILAKPMKDRRGSECLNESGRLLFKPLLVSNFGRD